MQFVLASASARRVDLLRQAGFDFETRTSGFPEVTLEDPKATAEANARGKALTVAEYEPAGVVVAADTIVYVPGSIGTERILGQARGVEDVYEMLGLLQGCAHEVHSGVAVAAGGEVAVRHAVTTVRMRRLSEAEIDAYADFGEGFGKAGGYAIQGRAAMFVEWIGGDYTNVVGLPLALTVRMLEARGVRWYR